MSSPSFETLYEEHRLFVTRTARKLSQGDRDLADDLAQEAWLALLQIPEPHLTEPHYVRTSLKRAMYRWLARERAQQVVEPEHHVRRSRRSRTRVLGLRRNTPRVYIEADPTIATLHRRNAT